MQQSNLESRTEQIKLKREKMSKKEKIDRSLYTRLKEDKDQKVNFTSYSNPMYSERSNSNKNDSQSKFTIKTYVSEKKKNNNVYQCKLVCKKEK